MNISYKPITLCLVFAVLGSTLAFARPLTCAETGCRSYGKKAAAFHAPISKPRAASAYARYRLPNTTKDDWPAGMILGNADIMLTLRHWLSA
jgi:hypothetical protein